MADNHFQAKLNRYAQVIVEVGLNLRAGQRLIIRAPIQSVELVRLVTAKAYQAGVVLVDVLWDDEVLGLIRLQNARDDTLDEFSEWRATGQTDHLQKGNALLSISASNPDLLSVQDPERITKIRRAAARHMQAVGNLISKGVGNWCVVSVPTPEWAAKVFPELPADQQVSSLWEQIFELTRINADDPVQAWKQHNQKLIGTSQYLTSRQYSALKYTGPNTQLTLQLPKNHRWMGGIMNAQNGISCTPNLPTEEVSTMPHKDGVDGYVTATMPLNYNGMLITNFSLAFEKGCVTRISAGSGQSILEKLVDTDEGAARLGEVALVPHSSPISSTARLFYNTLYDENASCHLALGRAYADSVVGGETMTPEEFSAAGGNLSLIHVDFMVGSAELDIDGINADGTIEPVLRAGEWATPMG